MAQRGLDGEPVSLEGTEARAVEGFGGLMARYAASLEVRPPTVDAVMAAVGRGPGLRPWWRWLLQPRAVRLRPAVVAAALAAVVAASWWVGRRERAPEGVAAQAATVLVQFELAAPQAGHVVLAGSFNGWDPESVPMARSPASGMWTVTLRLRPGAHQYLFLVDGERWVPDPRAHAQVDDGFGQRNSVIVVGPRGVVRS